MVNMTCPTIPNKPDDPKSFFQNGQLDFKAHDVGWIVCGIMTLIATISSTWLIWKHLTYYTCPQQQRHIVRLLIMVPVYAIVSFMSYLFFQEALYYQTIRDCYEAVLVTSFFYLILSYTGDTTAEQHAVFRNLEVKTPFWVFPLGSWKYKPSGLHFLWIMKICVLQYAIIRPFCTFVAVGTQYFGYYCLESWMPWFTHVWCALLISISVTVAMYCLIQLYVPVKKLVDPYHPILKFLSVKTIVFLTFWQDTFLSFLVSFNVIKETEYFTAGQIQAGINALLECFWMLLFGFIHIKAFSYLPYRPQDRSRTTKRGKALLDSLDFRDWFFEMKESTRYVAARSRGRNYTLAEDLRAKRHEHLLNALGTKRTAILDAEMDMEKAAMPTFWKNPEDAWTPCSDASESAFGGRHDSSDAKPWSRSTTNSSADAYTSLPNHAGRHCRQASKSHGFYTAATTPSTASRDSHAQRAAELSRLVAELDLQDQSIIGGEDNEYGYEDEKYERVSLMRNQGQQSPATALGKRNVDRTSKDANQHPELTRYHTADIQLANVPSLTYTYDQETPSESVKRTHDLSAVAEEDEDAGKSPLMRQGSRTAPGVGAFGVAAWFGWGSGGNDSQQPANASNYLLPGISYSGQQHITQGTAPGQDGAGWWRNYWNRVSNADSREPSVVGKDDEESEPLNARETESPAVMKQVRAGSWGIDSSAQNNSDQQQRSLPHPPALRIDTNDQRNARSRDEASMDSPRITPHADSPLSRLIQTSRDSFGSLNRNEVRGQLQQQTSASPSQPALPTSRSVPAALKAGSSIQPTPAPRGSSIAPSSNQASVSRIASTATPSAAVPSASSPPAHQSAVTAAETRQLASEIVSTARSNSQKHPIVFADALDPSQPSGEEQLVSPTSPPTNKALPPAVGPKGKLFNLVLPPPLSPARFPYGQEGQPALNCDAASSPAPRREGSAGTVRQHSAQRSDGSSALKWAPPTPKPLKSKEEERQATIPAKLPEGKGVIVVGGMSLAQAKAQAQADAEAEARANSKAQQAGDSRDAQRVVSAPATPIKPILKSESKPLEGKLVLPAPSKMASIETEDPYRAGQSAALGSRVEEGKRRASGGAGDGRSATTSVTRSSIANTAFEVGSIVPREAVYRASMPPGSVTSQAPLNSYYSSTRQSQQYQAQQAYAGSHFAHAPRPTGRPGGKYMERPPPNGYNPHPAQQQQRHSFGPMSMQYAATPMMPSRPSQFGRPAQQQQQPPMPHRMSAPQQGFHTSQQAQYRPRPAPPQQYRPRPHPAQQQQQQQRWSQQAQPQGRGGQGGTSQFKFEYYG